MTELNPCPLCKGEMVIIERVGGFNVDCKYTNPWECYNDDKEDVCDFTNADLFPTEDEAISDWNSRTLESELRRRIDILNQIIEGLEKELEEKDNEFYDFL